MRTLAEDDPFITAPKAPFRPGERDLSAVDPLRVLERFAQERQATIDLLSGLGPEQWQRPARHSIYGLTTLLDLALQSH